MVRALAVVALVTLSGSDARADRDLCARGAKHHGTAIDLDVKDAEVHDVFRLLADVGHVNLVVSDEVTGKVTLHIKGVAWDLAMCTIAGVHHFAVTLDDNIVLVRKG